MPGLEKNLGSPDTKIRENSMEILWKWETRGILTEKELIELGKRLATNLSFGLGENGTDSVFLRLFSALNLRGVIHTDKLIRDGKLDGKKPYLTKELILKWLEQTLDYFVGEEDFRGYVPIKEWAHSLAHCGDLLWEIALHPLTGKKEHSMMLDALANKFTQPANDVFTASEEARICRVVAAVQKRNLVPPEEYEMWLKKFITPYSETRWFDDVNEPLTFQAKLNARINVRLFIQRIAIMLQFSNDDIVEGDEEIY
ncbi:MAG: DUF2785 domain-containing protein, partial [Candidatus Heimdallarchaeota archaeon]